MFCHFKINERAKEEISRVKTCLQSSLRLTIHQTDMNTPLKDTRIVVDV